MRNLLRFTPLFKLEASAVAVSRGAGLAVSPGGDVAAAWDNPPQLAVGNATDRLLKASDASSLDVKSISDIDFSSGLDVYLADSWSGGVLRLDRRMEPKNLLRPETGGRFEPVSLCLDDRGALFVLDRAGADVWRIERGRAQTTGWGNAGGSLTLKEPRRIRFDYSSRGFYVLDGEELVILDHDGRRLGIQHLGIASTMDIAITNRNIYVLGEGLAVLPRLSGPPHAELPADSLRAWGIYPAAALAVRGDSLLYILPKEPRPILVLRIESALLEKP